MTATEKGSFVSMIYLDNAATTHPSEVAVKAALRLTELFANPASLHSFGAAAEGELEKARASLAATMGIEQQSLYFTSGGTMSDNIAVRGYLQSKRGGRVITSAFEHAAVAECFRNLPSSFEAVYLKPENGIITADSVERALTPDTVFVSIMQVNNETGAKNDIAGIASLLRANGIVFHTDAVQGYLKEPFNYSKVDMASFSGHKTHGFKGIGAIYIKKGLRPKPMIYGGGQENNIQSGTVNTVGASAWAAAAEELYRSFSERYEATKKLNGIYREIITSAGGKVITPETNSPYILSAAFPGYLGENLLHFLSEKSIYVSTGSACSSKKGSTVLKAVGYEQLQKSVIRLSFGTDNTADEAEVFGEALKAALAGVKKYM